MAVGNQPKVDFSAPRANQCGSLIVRLVGFMLDLDILALSPGLALDEPHRRTAIMPVSSSLAGLGLSGPLTSPITWSRIASRGDLAGWL